MAIPHAQPGEPVDIGPLAEKLPGERTTAIFKGRDLEVMRLVVPQGKSLPSHQVAGEITIQCIEGALEISGNQSSRTLSAGQLMYLPGGAEHGVTALQDAIALVTIALK